MAYFDNPKEGGFSAAAVKIGRWADGFREGLENGDGMLAIPTAQ